ncbi:Murein hydrolase activator EnvC precursor [compost metagenome]
MVIIDHGGGIQTLYAHGEDGGIQVQLGDKVIQGQPVLKIGSTGYSTGPHAHFEVRVNGQPVNPLPYVTRSYTGDETNQNTINEIISETD